MSGLNTQTLSEVAGRGFWVEPDGGDTLKVGVVNNRDASQVEADLTRLRDTLKARQLRTRFTGRGVFRLLRVWTA